MILLLKGTQFFSQTKILVTYKIQYLNLNSNFCFQDFFFQHRMCIWYSGVTARLSRWESGFESHCRPVLFVLQQDTLSTLLLSTQVLNGDLVGCERNCGWVGIMRACKTATGRNAPQGVEKVHSECRIVSESYDRGNNTLWSALIIIWKSAI